MTVSDSQCDSLTHSHCFTLSPSLFLFHSLFLITHTPSLHIVQTRTQAHSRSYSLFLSFFLTLLSLSLSLSHRHSFTDSFSPSLPLSLPLSLAFPHNYYLCLPIFLIHKPWGWSSSTSNKFFSTYSNTRYSLPVM